MVDIRHIFDGKTLHEVFVANSLRQTCSLLRLTQTHKKSTIPFFACLDIGNQYRAFNLGINMSFMIGEYLAKHDTPSLLAL